MSQSFNPYSEWLDVPPHIATPTYYELLELRPLESDTGKIEAAYQRQSAKIASQLSGRHVAEAQQLMGELAEARMTLLTPTAKRAYDAALATAQTAVGKESHMQSANPPHQPIQPMAPQPLLAQPLPAAGYGQPQAMPQPGQGYGGQPGGYAPAYGAQPVPTPMPVYPGGQAYPGWPGQPGVVASAPAPGYVLPAAPQAVDPEAPA
ncbi:MAG: hypothetical protein ACREHD_21380, partial [Pirellulales bacterium]